MFATERKLLNKVNAVRKFRLQKYLAGHSGLFGLFRLQKPSIKFLVACMQTGV
jgi:hypothetical protein